MHKSSINLLSGISWSAIFAGALMGFMLNFLFNLIMLALGLSIFLETGQPSWQFSILGFMAFLFMAVFAMFITGWIAGRLTPPLLSRIWGALFGLLSWTILFILTVVIIMNVIQFTSFHSNFTSHPNLVAIRISNTGPMMTETQAPTVSSEALAQNNIEKAPKVITLNAYVTFILFFVGALSSAIGGLVGYTINTHRNPYFIDILKNS